MSYLSNSCRLPLPFDQAVDIIPTAGVEMDRFEDLRSVRIARRIGSWNDILREIYSMSSLLRLGGDLIRPTVSGTDVQKWTPRNRSAGIPHKLTHQEREVEGVIWESGSDALWMGRTEDRGFKRLSVGILDGSVELDDFVGPNPGWTHAFDKIKEMAVWEVSGFSDLPGPADFTRDGGPSATKEISRRPEVLVRDGLVYEVPSFKVYLDARRNCWSKYTEDGVWRRTVNKDRDVRFFPDREVGSYVEVEYQRGEDVLRFLSVSDESVRQKLILDFL